jgi:hypothetical protein
MDGLSGRPGNGPSTGVAYAGNLVVGNAFGVTTGGLWLTGYRWWVPSTNGDTGSGQKFCLYQITGTSAGTIVPGSTVTAGALSAGWNVVSLSSPLSLTPFGAGSATTYGCAYMACTGKVFSSGFPETKNLFGAAETYAAGITNGPLTAFSSTGGTLPVGGSGGWVPQMAFTTSISDPAVGMPTLNDSDANLWLDVVVSDTAPAGVSYRGFPNEPAFVVPGSSPQASAYTLGLEFTLSQSCSLTRIWHYSPAGVTILPTRCAIWNVLSQTVVSGTDNASPAWSGAAGSGWVSCDYTGAGVTLASGTHYKVSTFTSDNTHTWFLAQPAFWGAGPDPFPSGITQGPLQVLGNAASTQGQNSWNLGITWTYPATGNLSNGANSPEFDGIDVEVTPVAAAPAQLPAFAYQMRSTG